MHHIIIIVLKIIGTLITTIGFAIIIVLHRNELAKTAQKLAEAELRDKYIQEETDKRNIRREVPYNEEKYVLLYKRLLEEPVMIAVVAICSSLTFNILMWVN